MQIRFPERYEYWAGVINEWKATGLSAAEFCRQGDIKREQFFAWKRRLTDRDREENEPVGFVPILFEQESGGCGVTVGMGEGVRLILSTGFDEGELLRAVRVLRGGGC